MSQFNSNSINLIYLHPNISTNICPMKVTYINIKLRLSIMQKFNLLNLFHLGH